MSEPVPLSDGWYEIKPTDPSGFYVYIDGHTYPKLWLKVKDQKITSASGSSLSSLPPENDSSSFVEGWRQAFGSTTLEEILLERHAPDLPATDEWENEFEFNL